MVPPGLSYDAVTQTQIHERTWDRRPDGYRRFESSVVIGRGDAAWASAADVLQWGVKTRSGFDVRPSAASASDDLHVVPDRDYTLVARIGPVRLQEPVRVVDVVDLPDRRGFAYGTRPGHPVSGEEAFIVHRATDGTVWLTLRSLTRASGGWRRLLFPAALLAQPFYRRRYQAALRQPA
ncbi:hypothetical protein ASE01_22740 [Nocardioides sp. Root190]|uniref:DUF1990 family protein n=1 Tax=Nocardioides sp. Root190 TaxID=1736488 RepID=UPI0006F6D6F6|nr:DUF1990 domain-containing protein [Nocardioides sp. Root190]KRB79555.1 hypothetical protein ASE01_22740 [Nocardioides sp. Root190]